jgi:hypothetical protein
MPVPALAALANPGESLSYELIGFANDAPDTLAESATFVRGLASIEDVTMPDWLVTPDAIEVIDTTVSYDAPASADLITLEVSQASINGPRVVWTVAVLDGRAAVTFPATFADLLPTAQSGYSVAALEVPGFNGADFTIDDASRALARISADTVLLK